MRRRLCHDPFGPVRVASVHPYRLIVDLPRGRIRLWMSNSKGTATTPPRRFLLRPTRLRQCRVGGRRVLDIEDSNLVVACGSDDSAVGGMRHELHREDVLSVSRLDLCVERETGVRTIDIDSSIVTTAREKGSVTRPSGGMFVNRNTSLFEGRFLLQRVDTSAVSPQLSNDIQVPNPSSGAIELVDGANTAIAFQLPVEEPFVEIECPGHDERNCRCLMTVRGLLLSSLGLRNEVVEIA